MFQYVHLIQAVNTANGWRPNEDNSKSVRQLVSSLLVYKERGEYDGTVSSALECLERAEYEFDIPEFKERTK
jgi:hypothetical protein